ncbi:glutamate 5-kinase [Futiania mangrovi]|uniref:Glutamate 5-kinase n=1 Tax=Futiania mangrovi TaxID=2959716 RepID=A0A9J6PJI9_9PROT|nr:glutamate 5-kinase [Futiania mangrovii]MCP1336711.1 glutamate 5-kinase [Futiania mangrovii]
MSPRLDAAQRVVIKIGSALLVDKATGEVNRPWLDALAGDVARLHAAGKEVILVSSGSIALGRRVLKLPRTRGPRLEEAQAAAAAGQIRLAGAYVDALKPHGISVAQILLTPEDTERRRRYLNARATLQTLLKLRAVPVINENDTVATQEIRFGDNDRLAARVSVMAGADVLVLLSDIDGLYTADPTTDPLARFIPEVPEITAEIEAMCGTTRTDVGTGGMVTKIMAARIAVAGGCSMVITSGKVLAPVAALQRGARATWFPAAKSPAAARKQWIAGTLKPTGRLVVDAGAARALKDGRSLLPAGVTAIEGSFEKGDTVVIADAAGHELARGLASYGADEARRIQGRNSRDIEVVLGYRGRDVLVHRDDLVLTG